MSSYMVDKYKIKTIAQEIEHDRETYCAFYKVWGTDKPQAETIAAMLYEMNAAAMEARYGSDERQEVNWRAINYSIKLRMDPHSINKLLEEYLYQCCEGNVTETDLYKAVERWYIGRIEHYYHLTPEYKRAASRDEKA